jgi:hypothetical protein
MLAAACATRPDVASAPPPAVPQSPQSPVVGSTPPPVVSPTPAEALLDRSHRWRAVPVSPLPNPPGTPTVGATATEMRARAARQAAAENRPVAYQTEDGSQRVEAYPSATATTATGCRQVEERIYQNGQLLQVAVREVCG